MGRMQTTQGNVEMTPFKSPYSKEELVARAKTWVGKSISRAEWRQGETCIHLVAFSLGWGKTVPDDWSNRPIQDLYDTLGWQVFDEKPTAGDICVLHIKDSDHLGICSGDGKLIYAGSLCITESSSDRLMKYCLGVLRCQ